MGKATYLIIIVMGIVGAMGLSCLFDTKTYAANEVSIAFAYTAAILA